ncbi:hypothetical protein I546_1154 [Mycobacterium kansasii 732]|nr:hypothetical protein I546_1154 [Mycobacterium kansasii 732]
MPEILTTRARSGLRRYGIVSLVSIGWRTTWYGGYRGNPVHRYRL